jgi:hypothetical protein
MRLLYSICCVFLMALSALYFFASGADWGRTLTDRELAERFKEYGCDRPTANNKEVCRLIRQEQQRRRWLGWPR